ncbi:MAG: DUF1778 domain-containing protein [Scrofimicrobium sp.]
MSTAVKSERIQLRVTSDTKEQIARAARMSGQDATSFILDAATARARSVILEEQLIKFSSADLDQIERAIENAGTPPPELVELFRKNAKRFTIR